MRTAITTILFSLIFALPALLFYTTYESALDRGVEMYIFSFKNPFITGRRNMLETFLTNYADLFSPDFMFIHGDPNMRHSIGAFGMLGPVFLLVLLLIIFTPVIHENKRIKKLFCFSCVSIVLSYLGSALTKDNGPTPHSLRANSASVFYIIIISIVLTQFLQKSPNRFINLCKNIAVTATLALGFLSYVIYFFKYYLPDSAQYFYG